MFRPLLLISYSLNYALHGQQVSGYRWVNLSLHLLCSIMVVVITLGLLREKLPALVAGFLFLLHPTHGEPVNYLSSRSDLLVSAFYLFAFLLAVRLQDRVSWGSMGAYIAALLTKSVAITLPVILLGYDFWFMGWKKGIRNRIKAGLLVVISGIYLIVITANSFLAHSVSKVPRGMGEQLLTQAKGLVFYIWLFIMPIRLSVEHPFCVSLTLWEPAVLLASLLLASLLFWLVKGRRWLISLGGIWFFILLLPVSIVPLNILVSERRMYLASVGLVFIVAWIWQKARRRYAKGMIAISLCWGLIFVWNVVARNKVWASDTHLWEDAVEKGPGMFRSRANLGLAYRREGRDEDAERELHIALSIKPDYADAWAEMGNIYHARGVLEAAEAAYKKGLEFNPAQEGIYYNLGNIYQEMGQVDRAVLHYLEALKRKPDYAEAHNNLGQAYEANGALERAEREYQTAISIDDEMPQAWFNLAALEEKKGRVETAQRAYGKAYQLLIEHPDFQENALYQEFARRAKEGHLRVQGIE